MFNMKQASPKAAPDDRSASGRGRDRGILMALVLASAACSEAFDAGSNTPHGALPVDERNPIILVNDGSTDNWQGEYALLLANTGGPSLAGIIVGTSGPWPDIAANLAGWRDMVAKARSSGLRNIPDPKVSIGSLLKRPANGDIDSTVANRSDGAFFIVDTSKELGFPYRPLVVVTGGRLTDVADAYLVDHTVVDRVVVVSSLGSTSASGALMGQPNGEMDPWADTIVTARFRYVQVSAFYDQTTDVPASRLSDLPTNDFGAWIAAKQPNIWDLPQAADQVAVAAVAMPGFAVTVKRVAPSGPSAAGATSGPALGEDAAGSGYLVREIAPTVATTRLWRMLTDPKTFSR
jgi:hypothetical protein